MKNNSMNTAPNGNTCDDDVLVLSVRAVEDVRTPHETRATGGVLELQRELA